MKNKKHKIRNLIIYPLTMLLMTSGSSFASQIYKIGETSKGNIYWGNREYNSSFFATNDIETNTYIEDRRRDEDNPQVILYNSHDLSLKDIRKICAIICDMENIDPTDFDRDYESLVLEWIFHHTAYQFGYKIDHSKDINFDNNDKEFYDQFKIERVFDFFREENGKQKIK